MAKIGIFGGSFNPPHLGHMLAVREFQEKLSLDCVLLIPVAQPPHKQLTCNSPTGEHRLAMTRLAAQTLPNVQVLDMELRREGTSYTADTIEELRKSYPNDELFLLIGTDMFLSFEKWHQPERITKEATLVAACRDGETELEACAKELEGHLGAKTIFLKNDYLPFSSTSARAMLAFGCGEEYLCPAVMEYIRKHGLYYCGENLRNLTFERLRQVSLSLHLPKRVAHVMGCSQTAKALARKYGANERDAERAGILHDITKALRGEEQLKLCERYAMITSDLERESPKLLHAKTGAAVARHVFGENDEVFESIYWHTTGKAAMSLLEKIIYLADYMEPNREFEGVDELRRLAAQDLDEALILGLQMSVDQLNTRKLKIDPNSMAALRFLKERN